MCVSQFASYFFTMVNYFLSYQGNKVNAHYWSWAVSLTWTWWSWVVFSVHSVEGFAVFALLWIRPYCIMENHILTQLCKPPLSFTKQIESIWCSVEISHHLMSSVLVPNEDLMTWLISSTHEDTLAYWFLFSDDTCQCFYQWGGYFFSETCFPPAFISHMVSHGWLPCGKRITWPCLWI